jgi:hypothetical protein
MRANGTFAKQRELQVGVTVLQQPVRAGIRLENPLDGV